MRFENTKDILNHISNFHDILSEYYHNMSVESKSKRLKLLLDYLSERENKMAEVIDNYNDSASHKILDHWFQYSVCSEKIGELKQLMNNNIYDADQIVDLAIQFDECFIDMLKEIANNADNDKVKELFENLIQIEEMDEKHISLSSQRLYDM